MKTSRREFLGHTAAVPVLLAAGCSRSPAPGWFEESLARIRSDRKFGLVVRIAPSPDRRCHAGHLLMGLHNDGDAEVREVFAEALCLVLEDAVVRSRIAGARPEDGLVAVDADGYAVDGAPFKDEDRFETFAAVARAVLHGPDGARLKAKSEAIYGQLRPPVREALDRLDSKVLREHAATMIPLLVERRLNETSPERQERLREIIDDHYRSGAAHAPGPRLPYGVQTQAMPGGCADNCEEKGPNSGALGACGMAIVTPGSRFFLRYLTT